MEWQSQLLHEGKLDSSGHFTLDPTRALNQLTQCLLQPEDTLLYLMQSAVASGASLANVETGAGEVVFRHDGFFPDPIEVPMILEWALKSPGTSEEVARHRLGLAVASSLASAGGSLCFDYNEGNSLEWRSASGRVELLGQVQPHSRAGAFRLKIPRPWWHKIPGLARSRATERLRQLSAYAPLRQTYDRKTLAEVEFGAQPYSVMFTGFKEKTTKLDGNEDDPLYFADHHLAEMRLHRSHPPGSKLGISNYCGSSWPLGKPRERGEWCTGAVGWRLKSSRSLVELVQYGVTISSYTDPELPGPVRILIADDQFNTDLSFLKLRSDEENRVRIRELFAEFADQFAALKKQYHGSHSQQCMEAWLVRQGRHPQPP